MDYWTWVTLYLTINGLIGDSHTHISKKDRTVMENSTWNLKFLDAVVLHLPIVNIDHNPILLNLEKT